MLQVSQYSPQNFLIDTKFLNVYIVTEKSYANKEKKICTVQYVTVSREIDCYSHIYNTSVCLYKVYMYI